MPQTGKKTRIAVKYGVFAAIILIIIFYFRDSIRDILYEVENTSLEELTVMIILSFLYFLIEGRIISMMAKKYNSSFSLLKGIGCTYFCNFYRIATFGSGTGVAEIYYLKRSGVDGARATGMSLVQYIIQKITTALYGIVGYYLFYRSMEKLVVGYETLLSFGFFAALVIAGVLLMISTSDTFSGTIFYWVKKICREKEKWMRRTEKWERQIAILQAEARELLKDKKKLLKILGYDFVKMTLWYLIPYVTLRNGAGLSIAFSAALMAVTFTLAGVIPAPSGFGSLELVFVLLYGRITGNAKAVSAILLFRFVTNIIPFVIGAVENFRFQKVTGQDRKEKDAALL
ncbi:MAG: YbhN family protein [Oliverpabstia sp.]